MKLIATKNSRYATRQLKAGDEFEATDMHARVLVGARIARYAPAAAPQPVAMTEEPSIDKLRAQAESLGIAVDRRWGAVRLQHEIDERR